MKPKTMILMVVAVVCGLGASYMTSQMLANQQNQPQEEEQDRVTVLFAKKNVQMGDPIKNPEELFVSKTVPRDSVPQNAISDPKALKGKMLTRPVRKDT